MCLEGQLEDVISLYRWLCGREQFQMHRLQNAESDWMDVWCRVVSEELLAEVIARVDQAEAEGSITPWEEGDVPASLLEDEPEPGKILSEKEVPVLGGTELTLSNGMKVFPVHSSLSKCMTTTTCRTI